MTPNKENYEIYNLEEFQKRQKVEDNVTCLSIMHFSTEAFRVI